MATNDHEKEPNHASDYVDDADKVRKGQSAERDELPDLGTDRPVADVVDSTATAVLAHEMAGKEVVALKARSDKEQADAALKADNLLKTYASNERQPDSGAPSVEKGPAPAPAEQPKAVAVAQAEKADKADDLAVATGAKIQEKADETSVAV